MSCVHVQGSLTGILLALFWLSPAAPAIGQGTLLQSGDLVVVGVNAHNGGCDGNTHYDFVSFFCFKPITPGTELIITDNGYERCQPGMWGNAEGTVKMTRTGAEIPAGQVITFRFRNVTGPLNVVGIAPDSDWDYASLNHPVGAPPPNFSYTLALNNGGDQLFFMQGGTWDSGTYTNGSNNHDATYDGIILFGFSTNPSPNWSALCTSSSSGNQRSNLPPGMECFSMAPTSSTDYARYNGPFTPAHQREWILRIENPTNWTSPYSCVNYNSGIPNWLSAPIMEILPGGVTSGLWHGTYDTDWFNCRNWDDARIPTSTTDVEINETALNHCIVGLATGVNPAGTGQCASAMIVASGNVLRNLIIQDGGTLSIGGGLSVMHSGGSGMLYSEVKENSTLNAEWITITGHSPGSTSEAGLFAKTSGSTVNLSGNLTINAGGLLDLSGGAGSSGTLTIGGDFLNNSDEDGFSEMNSAVILIGSNNQIINNIGFNESFHKLEIAKQSGDLMLQAPITINHELNLVQGRIFSTETTPVTISSNCFVNNASDASFIHGPAIKTGTIPFIFPIGKNASYRPASISGVTTTSAFIAEYFHTGGSTQNPIGTAVQTPPLDHVSNCEYWSISRTNGTSPAVVTLSWQEPVSCSVMIPSDQRVAYWSQDENMWLDQGGENITGTTSQGTVDSEEPQLFQAAPPNFWTLASTSGNINLPIELLMFQATLNAHVVDLAWTTASEQNNAFFSIERSADSETFTVIAVQSGAGTSQSILQYSDVDPFPLPGLSYYRLRQTDFNGTITWSDVVPINNVRASKTIDIIYQSDGLYILHPLPPGSTMEIMDPTGRMVFRTRISTEGPVRLPIDILSSGIYVVRVINANQFESALFAF